MAHGMQLTVERSHAVVVDQVRAAMQDEGLVVVCMTDLGETFNREFGMHIPAQVTLGVCTPELARAALAADPSVGLLVPCSVVVRATADEVTVVEAPTLSMIVAITGNRALEPIVEETTTRLRAAFDHVAGGGSHPGPDGTTTVP